MNHITLNQVNAIVQAAKVHGFVCRDIHIDGVNRKTVTLTFEVADDSPKSTDTELREQGKS